MDIKEFTNKVAEIITEKNKDLIVEVNNDVKKNNGVTLSGISIRNKDTYVSPIIYTNSFFDEEFTIEETAERIIEEYKEHKDDMQDFDATNIQVFDNVKDNIIAQVINKERNKDSLDDCPYAEFGDLVIIFKILVFQDKEKGLGSIRVNNDLMDKWGTDLSELIKLAYKNTKRIFPMEMKDMKDLLEHMTKEHNIELPENFFEDSVNNNMYVVSNGIKQNGAFFIADRESLLNIASELNVKKFLIFPSSINEIIILTEYDDNNEDKEYFVSMVKEVNMNEVPLHEILSDNVYIFDADLEELSTIEGTIIPFVA